MKPMCSTQVVASKAMAKPIMRRREETLTKTGLVVASQHV